MRRALVIGGSSGIGAAIAATLQKEGHAVVIASRRKPENCPHRWTFFDLRDELAAVWKSVELAAIQLGELADTKPGIDWIVIAGGVGAYLKPAAAVYAREGAAGLVAHDATAREEIETNLLGPLYTIEAAVPFLRRGDGEPTSRVLVIGSTIPRQPPKALAYYAAAKAGVEAGVRSEARRLVSKGIRINILATGWVETPMVAELKPEVRDKILRAIGCGRMAEPDEVARAAMAILEGPDYFVGDVIPMSGGL